MIVLAHRGYWNDRYEKNSPEAIRASLENGFGFESDIRDCVKELVISHDIADSGCLKAEEVFKWLREYNDKYTFAINIKSDGLKDQLSIMIKKYNLSNYFVFDMSVPQMVEYKETGIRFFTRQSEIEQNPCMYDDAAGIWIDGFNTVDWITKELLKKHLGNDKAVCLVSPDLHGKDDYRSFWERIKSYNLDGLMICTDHPDEAKEFFNEKDKGSIV